jgi:hypothetical protein
VRGWRKEEAEKKANFWSYKNFKVLTYFPYLKTSCLFIVPRITKYRRYKIAVSTVPAKVKINFGTKQNKKKIRR